MLQRQKQRGSNLPQSRAKSSGLRLRGLWTRSGCATYN